MSMINYTQIVYNHFSLYYVRITSYPSLNSFFEINLELGAIETGAEWICSRS